MFKVTFNADYYNFTYENLEQAEQVAKRELLDVDNVTTLAYIRDGAGELVETINYYDIVDDNGDYIEPDDRQDEVGYNPYIGGFDLDC